MYKPQHREARDDGHRDESVDGSGWLVYLVQAMRKEKNATGWKRQAGGEPLSGSIYYLFRFLLEISLRRADRPMYRLIHTGKMEERKEIWRREKKRREGGRRR